MMSEEREITVRSCEDLAVGTPIEAHRDGRLTHSGTVTEIAEHLGVFWIADNLSENRRLLDLKLRHNHKERLASGRL
jgi:hypothetical protein